MKIAKIISIFALVIFPSLNFSYASDEMMILKPSERLQELGEKLADITDGPLYLFLESEVQELISAIIEKRKEAANRSYKEIEFRLKDTRVCYEEFGFNDAEDLKPIEDAFQVLGSINILRSK